MLKTILIAFTLVFSNSLSLSGNRPKPVSPQADGGTLEKMIVANGSATLDLNLSRLNGRSPARDTRPSTLRFDIEPDSFFTIVALDRELRGPLPGAMAIIPRDAVSLPAPLGASYHQLVIEKTSFTEPFDLVIRDSKTGFVFFNIEGHTYDYDAGARVFSVKDGRMLVSKEFAAKLGRPSQAGSEVGTLSFAATMRVIEISQIVNGEVRSDVMPAAGSVPGPDVIVGDLNGLAQFDGSSGTQVGLAVGTDSCNAGTVDLNWFSLQSGSADHPVIPQNLYRMSGGATNDERFEQIGESNVKHAFTALTENICGFGCNGTGGTHLGSGCSDPYVASLNSGQSGHTLGSRAWINPFTGVFPTSPSPNSHTGHTHTGPAHRILVEISDLNTSLNSGATYYAEAQYVTPHEYAWCQTHAGQCNMYNNVSYRRYNVTGTGSPFGFSSAGSTQRMKPAINAWTGATINQIEPAPGTDGTGAVVYKVTNPSAGVWHYEYAVYNQNMDRAIQSFSVPLGAGITVSNIGFHAPPQQPGWANDGTVGNTGYSSVPWTPTQTAGDITWTTETFAQNPNANAIRWGTMYNYRFDSNRPPQTTNATVGFYKTGAPMTVQIQGPTPDGTPLQTVQFSAATYNAGEGDGSAIITVTRSGSAGTSTVNFVTADGTAIQSRDYTIASGTLTFNAGDTSKTFNVLMVDDAYTESGETVGLTLSGPTGATLGTQTAAALTVNDNDASGPSMPQKRFFAQLSGGQETPANASTAIGSGIVLLNSSDTSALTGLKFSSLGTNESAAHIHTGAAGVAGPVTFPLPTPTPPANSFAFADMPISPTTQQVSDLRGGLQYMNVHSTNFPNGEIRGQLLWNPTLENAFLVRQHYLDFLNREPDVAGLNFWIGEIHCPQGLTTDQADVPCYQGRTIGVSDAFFFVPEFHQTAGYVFLAYRAAYGNTQPSPVVDPANQTEANKLPEYNGFMTDRAKVLGGASLAAQQHAFANEFVARPEFLVKYPTAGSTGPTFVSAILATILAADGVDLSSQQAALVTQYNNAGGGNAGRAQVLFCLSLDDIAGNPIAGGNQTFVTAEYNRQFALTLYYGYLRRNPDINGFLFWQSQINLAPVGNVAKQNALVCSFMTSGEYQGRFGPASPRTNAECPQ